MKWYMHFNAIDATRIPDITYFLCFLSRFDEFEHFGILSARLFEIFILLICGYNWGYRGYRGYYWSSKRIIFDWLWLLLFSRSLSFWFLLCFCVCDWVLSRSWCCFCTFFCLFSFSLFFYLLNWFIFFILFNLFGWFLLYFWTLIFFLFIFLFILLLIC